MSSSSLFFHDTSTTKIYTLSLHDALPISGGAGDPVLASHRARAATGSGDRRPDAVRVPGSHEHRAAVVPAARAARSEEHTSELQSHSDLVCRLLLEKKKRHQHNPEDTLVS